MGGSRNSRYAPFRGESFGQTLKGVAIKRVEGRWGVMKSAITRALHLTDFATSPIPFYHFTIFRVPRPISHSYHSAILPFYHFPTSPSPFRVLPFYRYRKKRLCPGAIRNCFFGKTGFRLSGFFGSILYARAKPASGYEFTR